MVNPDGRVGAKSQSGHWDFDVLDDIKSTSFKFGDVPGSNGLHNTGPDVILAIENERSTWPQNSERLTPRPNMEVSVTVTPLQGP